jgi:CDP-glycerol glycerophosphotransferase (TagB/SpsB family)/glycosyltransferase involved in cell wall biosynthesis
MAVPRISVVVPFYNNADQLAECLASIAAQTIPDLEVIMVDDGSTDGSADIAAAQADADPRFTLLRTPNGGPGSARNRGVAAATGEYLAFVDGDDLLPRDAYATMLPLLESSGSDFVSGGVLRLTASGLVPSGLHDQAIKATQSVTHISRSPELCYDISVWNKLFRRAFWVASGLSFPEGIRWEDLVAMTKAHVLARSVDVTTDPVYYWRERDKGAPSITQSRTDITNFRDRVSALAMIDDFLRARGSTALLHHHQHKALVNDLWLYVRDLPQTSTDYQREFVRLGASYLRQVDQRLVAAQPTTRRLAYYLIAHDRQADLVEYARWLADNPGRTPPMVREFGRLQADLPLRKAAADPVPAAVFRPHRRELDPHVHVDKIAWSGRSLVIEGSAYVPSMDIANRRNTSKLVLLVPRQRGRLPVLLRARSVRRPDITEASGQRRYSYDWSGFRCEISPRWFGAGNRWLTGEWDCFVLVRGRSVWRPARLHTPGPQAQLPLVADVAPGISFGAYWAGRRLTIRLDRESLAVDESRAVDAARTAAIEQAWSSGGKLVLRGDLAPSPGGYQIVLHHLDGWSEHVIPITDVTNRADSLQPDRLSFSVEVPVGEMSVYGDLVPLRDGRWAVGLRAMDSNGRAGSIEFVVPAKAERGQVRVGRKLFHCGVEPAGRRDGAGLVLDVRPALGIVERGRIRRVLLREIYYRLQRLLPLRDAILFVSFDGHSCTDNPLGIAAELRRRGDQREQIWAVRDWSVAVPAGALSVLIGTADYFAALGRSRHLIANDHLAQPFQLRSGQRYVQTWHGTPLKRLGYDIVKPSFASGSRFFDFMAADVAQWGLLISPNAFSTPIMRQAFRYTGEIAETGYPRTDELIADSTEPAGSGGPRAAKPARMRRLLDLPDARQIALYVPTWRENQHDGTSKYRFDLRLDLADARRRLADKYVLLVRGHHLMAGWELAATEPGFAFDVTDYPDINDLLAITDVLITDYSSVMFDFAPTGRPMLFFTYDLRHYRDELRGFYFDFEAVAPGPLLETSDEVVAALADIEAVAAKYRQAHADFTARFCPLDDGKASARACDRIFKG